MTVQWLTKHSRPTAVTVTEGRIYVSRDTYEAMGKPSSVEIGINDCGFVLRPSKSTHAYSCVEYANRAGGCSVGTERVVEQLAEAGCELGRYNADWDDTMGWLECWPVESGVAV